MRRMGVVAALVAIVSSLLVVDARAASTAAPELCGPNDLPEGVALDGSPTPQLQGDVPQAHRVEGADGVSRAERGYNCGLALVAREVLDQDGRNPTGNANLAWASHCAYVTGPGTVFGVPEYDPEVDDPNGVAVVDVRHPADPVHVRTLKGDAASTQALETIYAVDVPGPGRSIARSILVVGQYGNSTGPAEVSGNDPMNVYDITGPKCRTPELVGTVVFPENIHNLTISGNGRYVFATSPNQVVDIEPLFDGDPRTDAVLLGNLDESTEYPLVGISPVADLDDAVPGARRKPADYTAHQVWSSFDGTRLYMGGTVKPFEVFTVLDISEWLLDQTASPVVLSQRNGRGHSVTKAGIGDEEWVMHAEESVFGQASGCYSEEGAPLVGPAEPYFSDVTDPHDPEMHAGRFGLEINRIENCPAQRDSGVQASVHYHEFDDGTDASFAILSMQNAGIRVVDVRDPRHPVEVAYFNPGDVVNFTGEDGAPDGQVRLDNAWGHPRYVPATGHIWFATSSGGFWVVELEQQVRDHFDLEVPRAPMHDGGAPGTVGAGAAGIDFGVELPPLWCTLSVPMSKL